MEGIDVIKDLVKRIYGEDKGQQAFHKILALIESFPVQKSKRTGYFSEQDVVLITYGDTLNQEGQTPLATLHGFANEFLKGAISNIHFLPFFPYSSDDGFSVMDFSEIDPALGTWNEVAAIGQDFELMLDYVVNHFSSEGQWFRNYLEGKDGYADFAIEVDPATDLPRDGEPLYRLWTDGAMRLAVRAAALSGPARTGNAHLLVMKRAAAGDDGAGP